MLFAVTCTDRPGALDVRLKHRSEHLLWASDESSPVKMAGPLLGAEGDPVGSLLIIQAENEEGLRDILATDPYAKADLFSDVFWIPFKWTVKAPEGL